MRRLKAIEVRRALEMQTGATRVGVGDFLRWDPKVAPKAAQPSGYWHNPVGIGKIGG